MTYKLPKRTLFLWQIRCFAAAAAVIVLLMWFALPIKILLAVAAALLGVTAALSCFYLPVFFDSFSLTVYADCLSVRQGVLLKTERIFPKKRMIYAEQRKTPLAAAFSLSSLCLRATKGILLTPELDAADAAAILEAMK